MRYFYNVLLILIQTFLFTSILYSQGKDFPAINDIKLVNGEQQFEIQNRVNGFEHPEGKGSFIPLDGFNTETFTSSNEVEIPETVSVVSDSVFVSGIDSWLYDLNLQTFITHSFCSDLNITLRSPSGKVVTVTSDNATDKADVFNGTIWDDQVNPGGQVPYSINFGLVTDNEFTTSTTASPLTPEENFSLFMGEDPNGWWILTIHDDQDEDGGSLAGWSIEITTVPSMPVMSSSTFSYNSELVIPNTSSVDSVLINVNGLNQYLLDAELQTWLRHTYSADLDITLKSPSGTVATLTTDNGSGHDNVFNGTLWDDQADPEGQVPYDNNEHLVTDKEFFNLVPASHIVPEESFAAFLGEDPNGTWVLTISDDADGDGGSLDSVHIHLTTTADILPVELTAFNYSLMDNGVYLKWMTISELNNKGFAIERSQINEKKWQRIGFIEGRGTTTQTNFYSFADKNISNNTVYLYRLKQLNFNGTFEYSKTLEVHFMNAVSYNLFQNFPNPFNPETKISFSIPEAGLVKLTVHNIIGETVSVILNEKLDKGIYSFKFNASNLPSGIYLCKLEVNNFKSTKKMILLK